MNDIYAINAAKTEFRDGYNTADVDRLLSVFADGFADLSAGVPSFFGDEAKSVLRSRTVKPLPEVSRHARRRHYVDPRGAQHSVRFWLAYAYPGPPSRRRPDHKPAPLF